MRDRRASSRAVRLAWESMLTLACGSPCTPWGSRPCAGRPPCPSRNDRRRNVISTKNCDQPTKFPKDIRNQAQTSLQLTISFNFEYSLIRNIRNNSEHLQNYFTVKNLIEYLKNTFQSIPLTRKAIINTQSIIPYSLLKIEFMTILAEHA